MKPKNKPDGRAITASIWAHVPARRLCLAALLASPLVALADGPSWFSKPGKSATDALVDPEQAFQFKAARRGPELLIATLTPAPGYYLYRDRIHIALQGSPGVTIKAVEIPRGEVKNDANFGKMDVFHQPVDMQVWLERQGAVARHVTLLAKYQGCNEPSGICYPPMSSTVTLALD